jgi:aminoglycoside phosphotransferase (APT) family kinase protein
MWSADIAVDAGLAAETIASQFPQFSGCALEPFGLGWDNAAFLVDGRVVFRFPRRRVAVRLIERECALLPFIAPYVPLAISAPAFVGTPCAAFPWPFAGYERLAGETASTVTLNATLRHGLARPLGRFLRALHGIDPAPFVGRGLPPDEIGRLDHTKRLRFTRERIASLAGVGVPDGDAFLEWLERHPPPALADARRTIVHGDLYARHVLLDDNGAPSGIIDWGDIHRGDPALDIAIAPLMLPATAYGAFREAYGPIDARTWSAATYRAIAHAVVEIDYGVRENDAGMRRIGVDALQLLRETLLADSS